MLRRIAAVLGPRLRFPAVVPLAICVAAIACVPLLPVGWLADDYLHVAVLEGFETPARPFDLYSFATGRAEETRRWIDEGPWPWWALPEVRLRFFRPLASALAVAEHAVFGASALASRLHAIAWYLLVVAGAGLLLRRVLPGAVGAAALLLFALDDAHFMPVGWTANRHALISAAPAFAAIAMHLAWRATGRAAWLAGALASLGAGLLAGETAIAAFGYIGAYELAGAAGPLRERLRALAPAAVLALVYVVAYKALGYGAYGSSVYVDPAQSPLRFAAAALVRVPALAGAQLLGTPVDAWILSPVARAGFVAAGLFSLALLAWLLRAFGDLLTDDERRHVKWFALGAALAVLPSAATFPSARLLLMPGLGAAVAVAAVLVGAWRALETRASARWAVRGIVALHVVVPLAGWVAGGFLLSLAGRVFDESVARTELDDATIAQERVVVLHTTNPISAMYPPIARAVRGRPPPKAWWALSFTPDETRLTRTAPNAFELEVVEGRFFATMFERLVRGEEHALARGAVVKAGGLRATVLDADEAGVKRLAFEFDRPLEDPSLRFLAFRDGTLRRVELPPVGGVLVLRPDGLVLGR